MVTEVKHQCPPHYWFLESPKGRISHGKCRFCGEERDFNEPRSHSGMERYLTPRRDGSQPYGFWELNKDAILTDVGELGEKEAVKKWEIPRGTWTGLRLRWGLPGVRKR